MMKKLISSVCAFGMMTSAALADVKTFYKIDVQPGGYMVYGVTHSYDNNKNPVCFAEAKWRDGSTFQLIRDLADGELYIWLQNTTWNIEDERGVYRMRANFYRNEVVTDGVVFAYRLINKNTIVIPDIKKEAFLPLFSGNQKMTFVMPGSIQNMVIDLTGSSKTLAEISKCVAAAKSVDLYPEGSPSGREGTSTSPRRYDNI